MSGESGIHNAALPSLLIATCARLLCSPHLSCSCNLCSPDAHPPVTLASPMPSPAPPTRPLPFSVATARITDINKHKPIPHLPHSKRKASVGCPDPDLEYATLHLRLGESGLSSHSSLFFAPAHSLCSYACACLHFTPCPLLTVAFADISLARSRQTQRQAEHRHCIGRLYCMCPLAIRCQIIPS